MFSRVTNSVVMTATVVAVIIGSLCFSAREGLRLTPFPNPTLAPVERSSDLNDAGTIGEVAVAKYGPLDVPAQTHKRGKRQNVDLAAGSTTGTQSVVTPLVRSLTYKAIDPDSLLFIAPYSGRAPPSRS